MEKEADERWGRRLGQGGHPGRCILIRLLITARCHDHGSIAAPSASANTKEFLNTKANSLARWLSVNCRTEWEVLDLQDVVVHVFTAEQREYFDLETFYGAAEEVELPFVSDTVEQQTAGDIAWAQRL
jgi:ribosomal silencing factor RsfS